MRLKLEIEASQEALEKLGELEGIKIISSESDIPEDTQKIIDGIIEDFNFQKVHDIMKYLNWTWINKNIPTIEQLKNCAENLLKSAYNRYFEDGYSEQTLQATGGFEATYSYDDYKDCFELRFVLTSVNNYY